MWLQNKCRVMSITMMRNGSDDDLDDFGSNIKYDTKKRYFFHEQNMIEIVSLLVKCEMCSSNDISPAFSVMHLNKSGKGMNSELGTFFSFGNWISIFFSGTRIVSWNIYGISLMYYLFLRYDQIESKKDSACKFYNSFSEIF